MGKIETITSKEFGAVRTVKLNGTMYFSSRDVEKILGFGDTISAVYMFVPAKYTRTILRSECGDTSIPKRGMPFVTADGVSALARQSKEPFAKDFKRWIDSVQEEFKMEKLTILIHPVFGTVRTVRIKDKPYFSLEDIKKALGYGKSSSISMFVSSCNERKILREDYEDDNIPKSGMRVIDECGVASLAKFSKKENAEQFKQWILNDHTTAATEEPTVSPAEKSTSDANEIKIFENPNFGKVRTSEIKNPIEIVYNEDGNPTVSGRELHDALEIETPYHKWFPRMCEYGFTEFKDFWTFLSESTGGRRSLDHQLTIPMAKELCMIQRSEKGRQFRQYFIDIEERWNTPEAVMARALQMAGKQLEEIKHKNSMLTSTVEEQHRQITAMQPKADYCDIVLAADDLIPITIIAKEYGMTAREMNNLLHKEHIQYKQGGTWLLYKEYADKGLTKTKTNKYRGYDGNQHVSIHTYWAQKGRHFIYEILKSRGVMPTAE